MISSIPFLWCQVLIYWYASFILKLVQKLWYLTLNHGLSSGVLTQFLILSNQLWNKKRSYTAPLNRKQSTGYTGEKWKGYTVSGAFWVILNPKSEARNTKQIRNSNFSIFKTGTKCQLYIGDVKTRVLVIRILVIWYCFEFRISTCPPMPLCSGCFSCIRVWKRNKHSTCLLYTSPSPRDRS